MQYNKSMDDNASSGEKMKKNVFVCKTTWEHFITLLVCANIYNKEKEKSVIIIEKALENSSFFKKIIQLEYFSECLQISLKQNRILKFILFKYRIKISLNHFLKKFTNNNTSINVFVDQSVISQYFIHKNLKLNLYEHGNGNYLVGAYPNFPILKKILGVTPGYGRSNMIENIYLQYPDKAPHDIKDKTKKLDLKNLFNSLTLKQQQEIYNIFDIPEILSSDNNLIILTQPFSEDGFMSESKKIKIYHDIIIKNSNKKIYIKPHPRDRTDYKKLFKKDIIVFPSSFPIEILNFKNIEFNTAITICSGSIYNFHYPINVEIIGTEDLPELIKPLGKIKQQSIPKDKYNSIQYI
ncbi:MULTISPECIES: glycosyltransferase family 52 [Providencia]|nr:glycosyltransferase family 52 [Providencia sp. PROV212]